MILSFSDAFDVDLFIQKSTLYIGLIGTNFLTTPSFRFSSQIHNWWRVEIVVTLCHFKTLLQISTCFLHEDVFWMCTFDNKSLNCKYIPGCVWLNHPTDDCFVGILNKQLVYFLIWCQDWLFLPMSFTSLSSVSVAGNVSASWSYWWSLGSSRVENSTSTVIFNIFLKVSIMVKNMPLFKLSNVSLVIFCI